jgi:hypothetical protein
VSAPPARRRRLLSKLRGRSAAELRSRGLHFAQTWLERVGLSPFIGEPTDDAFWNRLSGNTRRRVAKHDSAALLDEFRSGGEGVFFAGVADRDASVRCFRDKWPAAERHVIERADRCRAGRFDLLGYEDLDFGNPIDWHRDPVAGISAPRRHWSRVAYLDPAAVGDHKVIWELNRHQYFLTLGRAYWLTGDEGYAAVIADHLSSWMDANPPKVGVNWASSLEVSFRAISWTWALHFLRCSPHLTAPLFRRVVAFLDLHARHVAGNLSTYFSPNTHLTGEALGLFVVGTAFPQLDAASDWRRIGRAVLEGQIALQVRPDGSYVEQSLYYHRYTLDIFLHGLALALRAGQPLRGVEQHLQAALDHAMYLTRPDGLFSLIGDDDGGELLPLSARPTNDFRGALGTGAAVFARADYAAAAGSAAEETLWLLGPSGIEDFDTLVPRRPAATSRGFPAGGYYIMRDSWSESANVLVIDGGPHGFLNAGHAHADSLSIEVSVSGRPLFIDPGTLSYSADLANRNRFRGTAAHNTVVIDGLSSSEIGHGAFQWNLQAETRTTRWESTPAFDLFEGWHDGFMRLRAPARHERTVAFLHGQYWVIRDRIVSDGEHDVSVYFHCAPDVRADKHGDGSIRFVDTSAGKEVGAQLTTFASNGELTLRPDWISPRYGRRVAATTCEFKLRTNGMEDIISFIIPVKTAIPNVVPASAPGVFIVTGDGFEDTLSIGANSLTVNDVDLSAAGQRVDHVEREAVSASSTSRVGG